MPSSDASRLLDTTTNTLRELNEVLLRDTHHFVALLQEIQALASEAEQAESEEAVQRVIEHVDRIAPGVAPGSARGRTITNTFIAIFAMSYASTRTER